jgi:MoaA/NifB/PqqE/SkfB family radical SAM enzyme
MNLLITDICNKECPYCFAQEKVAIGAQVAKSNLKNISLANVQKYLDFLEAGNDRLFKILGGEPTVHPQFSEIVQMGLDRGMNVIVFTNGIWNRKVLDFVEHDNSGRLGFVVNINEPDTQTDNENRKQHQSLAVMGRRAIISFNIYRSSFDMLFTADLINKYELRRGLRLGLAHPIVNIKIDYPKHDELKQIGKSLVHQLRILEKQDILGEFDCGFPMCMFDEQDFADLHICSKPVFHSTCDFIVDVGVNLDAWPCFPLSEIANVKIEQFDNGNHLLNHYQRLLTPVRQMGSLNACQDCKFHRRGQCCGGCTGRTLIAWQAQGDSKLIEKLNKKAGTSTLPSETKVIDPVLFNA